MYQIWLTFLMFLLEVGLHQDTQDTCGHFLGFVILQNTNKDIRLHTKSCLARGST